MDMPRPSRRTIVAALGGMAVSAGTSAWATTPSATASEDAAQEVLRRRLPDHWRQFSLRTAGPVDVDGQDAFRVSGGEGRIVIEGTGAVAQLTGVHWYLKHVARAHISWNGEQLGRLPRRLPGVPEPLARSANAVHRFAFNDTNEGYTGPYRDWPYWEREIDVLALHGINEVLVYLGTDSVYHRTFQRFGYSDAEMRNWIPGPAHQPWWLLQNMSGFGGPVSPQLLDTRAALAAKIVRRLRELGMTPVLPGYFGTVPTGFAERNPGARTVPQGTWVGFQRPDWLDPRTGLFSRVAHTFYEVQSELFGDSAMYKMDLLHEGGRPGDVPVGEAAKAVEAALRRAHPGAVWAILGWQHNPPSAIIDAVDKEKMLVVDGLSDRFSSVTDREADWAGTPYAFGSIWNFGGHTAMGANTPDWAALYDAWRRKPDSALRGIALMPEAADNNPAAFELFTDLPWSESAPDLTDWFADWSVHRYGGEDAHAAAAWNVLRSTAYGTTRADSWSEAADGLYGARPSLSARSAASWSPKEARYDTREFDGALTELLAVDPALRDSSAYRYDLADVARQVLSNRSRVLLPQLEAAYEAGDRERFGELSELWLHWMGRLEDLLGTSEHHLLGSWLAEARSWGKDEEERDRLEFDALTLLTVWGHRSGANAGGLHDYANREWAGLVGGLYTLRWRTYLTELNAALAKKRTPKAIDWFTLEDGWVRDHGAFATKPSGDTYRAAREIRDMLAADTHQTGLTASLSDSAVTAERPVTLTARFTDHNGFAPAREVSFSLVPPAGMEAELTRADATEAAWTVSVTGPVDDLVASLTPVAHYTVGGTAGSVPADAQVMTATGVRDPYRTVSFNDAVFGQSGNEGFAIRGGGRDLWGGTNEFGAVHLPGGLTDGSVVTTRVVHQDRTGGWARAGLVVRNSLATGGAAGFVNLAVTPAHGVVLSWDAEGDGRLESYRSAAEFVAPVHLRLTRRGQVFTGECSTNGTSWTEVASVTVSSAAVTQDVGLFMSACNGGSGAVGIAEFDGFGVVAG